MSENQQQLDPLQTTLRTELNDARKREAAVGIGGFKKQDTQCIKYYLIFQWTMYIMAVFAYTFGQPLSLNQPYDPDNQACGIDINVQGFNYIYFATPDPRYLYRTVCVAQCPTLPAGDSDEDESLSLDCSQNSLISSCDNHPSVGFTQYQVLYYDTVPYKSVCLPTQLGQLLTVIDSARQPFIASHLHDFESAKYILLFSLLVCLFLNATYLQQLHKHTKSVVYFMFFIIEFSLGAISLLGFAYAAKFEDIASLSLQNPNTVLSEGDVIFQAQVRSVSLNAVLAVSGIFACLFLLTPFLLCCYRSNIQRMINSLRIASEFLCTMGEDASFVPIMASSALLVNLIFWFYTTLYLFSMGSVNVQPNELPYEQFKIGWYVYLFAFFHVFNLIWTTSFIIGTSEYVHCLATILCYEYKINHSNPNAVGLHLLSPAHQPQPDEDDQTSKQYNFLGRARELYIFSHSGSVIFGQIMISLVTPFRMIVVLCWKLVKPCAKCCKFFRTEYRSKRCYTHQLGAITQDAYLFSYLKDLPFCQSSLQIHLWITENFDEEYQNVGQVGRNFIWLTQLSTGLLNSLIFFLLITKTDIKNQISSPATATFLAFVFSYSISYLFASVYGSCIDTLYLIMKRDTFPNNSQSRGGENAPDTLRYLVSPRIQ